MKKFGNEFVVGLFVLACVAGLIYLTFSTGKVDLKKEGYHIYAVFNEIAGLDTKAPVMLNGLEVGKVDDIQIIYDDETTKIKLKLWIKADAKIRENPAISIKTLGLMGEKYIQIASSHGKGFIQPEAVLAGKPYLDLDALMEQALVITEDVTTQVNKLLAGLNGTVEENKGSVTQIIKNLETSSKNLEEFSDDLKRHPWKLLMKGKETPKKGK